LSKFQNSGPEIVVTFISKTTIMKKTLMFLVLACLVAAIAFASLRSNRADKQTIEKKQDAKKTKKECSHTCIFG
jgi:preprotein translocase subunit SecG